MFIVIKITKTHKRNPIKRRNAKVSFSILLVSIYNDINVIKNYIYVILDNMNAIFLFFYYIYITPDGH
jgi:hypothetical protein